MSAVPTVLSGSDQTIYEPAGGADGVGTLYGWSFRSTLAASVNFRADSLTGPIIAVADVAANGVSTVWFDGGVKCAGGIYVDVVSGTPVGSVFHG